VLENTIKGEDTVFFDGEGGFCYIALNILKSGKFKFVTILEKDRYLQKIQDYATDSYLQDFDNYEIKNINFAKMASDSMSFGEFYVSPFLSCMPESSWEDPEPSCTIVTSASQAFIKYLTHKCLYRAEVLSEFSDSRPEFFFIVTMRTYMHMSCGLGDLGEEWEGPEGAWEDDDEPKYVLNKKLLLMQHFNVLFQLLFHNRLVDVVPRKAYYPWKPHNLQDYYRVGPGRKNLRNRSRQRPPSGHKPKLDQYYAAASDDLMMVHARPRPNFISTDQAFHLEVFVLELMKKKTTTVVRIFENWVEGSGLMVIEAGYTVMTQVGDLNIPDVGALFHILMDHPGIATSNFQTKVDIWQNMVLQERRSGSSKLDDNYNILLEKVRKELNIRGPVGMQNIFNNFVYEEDEED